jgi:hypothetical protein
MESAANSIAEASAVTAPNADLEQRFPANQMLMLIILRGVIANSQITISLSKLNVLISSADQNPSDDKAELRIMMHQPTKNPLEKEFLCVARFSPGAVSIFG